MSMMRRGKTGAKGRAAPLYGKKRRIRKNRDDPAARRDRPCSLVRMLHSALRGFPEANEKSRRFQEV